MTIFDSIRYPVTIPHVYGEPIIIPEDIKAAWIEAYISANNIKGSILSDAALRLLRKVIADWDTDN